MPDTAFYATLVEQTQAGKPWYGPAITQVVEGLTVQQAAARPIPGAHSIWEIVLHMTGWVREVRRRLDQGHPRMPDDGDWPEAPHPSEGNWWQSLDELQSAHAELREALQKFPESKLSENVGTASDQSLGSGVSYAVMLQGLLQHDAYHLGQVALLKRALEGKR
jgi:uncharacterized damage-inducible protein DinB